MRVDQLPVEATVVLVDDLEVRAYGRVIALDQGAFPPFGSTVLLSIFARQSASRGLGDIPDRSRNRRAPRIHLSRGSALLALLFLGRRGPEPAHPQAMHLRRRTPCLRIFDSLRPMVDVADLDQLDGYGYDRGRSWSPDEATAMAIRRFRAPRTSISLELSCRIAGGAHEPYAPPVRVDYRIELNADRSSDEKSSGSSQAAKWPPLSTSLK